MDYKITEQTLETLARLIPEVCYKDNGQWVLNGEALQEQSGVIVVKSASTKTYYILQAFGESRFLKDWVSDRRCKVSHTTLLKRVRRGESAESAISRPWAKHDRTSMLLSERYGWDRLSPHERDCVVLRIETGSNIAVAERLGTQPRNVMRALDSARVKTGHPSVREMILAWKSENQS